MWWLQFDTPILVLVLLMKNFFGIEFQLNQEVISDHSTNFIRNRLRFFKFYLRTI